MNPTEVFETQYWRALDRRAQTLSSRRRVRAQAVIDIAEDARRVASSRQADAVDSLLRLYHAVHGTAAKQLVADAIQYLRAEIHLSDRPINLACA